MLAIDTNVIVRYLVGDDPARAAKARKLADNNTYSSVPRFSWKQSGYCAASFSDGQCAKALADFAGLPRVTVEDAAAAAKAVGWMRQGVDFADGLHLAKAEACDAFVSFDRDFAKAANTLGATKVRAP